MANTERLRVLQGVQQAKAEVDRCLREDVAREGQREYMQALSNRLEELRDILIMRELQEVADQISEAAQGLEETNAQLRGDIKGLEEVANRVDQVAKGVKILAEIASQGSKLLA